MNRDSLNCWLVGEILYGEFSRCVYTWKLQNALLFATTNFNFIETEFHFNVTEISFENLSLLGDYE